MKIIAIWDRCKVAPKSKTIFVLTDSEKFIEVQPEEIFCGRDGHDKRLYKDTGNLEIFDVYKEDEKFDFNKADYFIRHFGGNLIWQDEEKLNVSYKKEIIQLKLAL